MPEIQVSIANKIATVQGAPCIVCGNTDYTARLSFDAEWDEYPVKTARLVYTKGGKLHSRDVIFEGNSLGLPALSGIQEVYIGFYAGDLRTTTPARVPCKYSILCADPVHEDPPQDVYNQLMELLAGMSGGGGAGVAGTLVAAADLAGPEPEAVAGTMTQTNTEEG